MDFLGRILAASVFLLSQSPSTPAPGEPIAIEFFANGPDGPVFDLRPDEVTLRVDGRPREIRSLRYVSLPAPDPTGAPPAELEPPYGTNVREAAGRWVTVVVDHESIPAGAEKNVMNAAVRFVNALGPRDQVSYVTAPRGGVEVQFTTEHSRVTSALKRFVGTAPREENERDRSCRSRLLLNAMRDLFEDLDALDGPKLVTIISSGVLNPRRDAPALGPPGMCEISIDDFQQVRVAAARAGIHVLVVQPDHLEIESARNSLADPTLSRFSAADADRAGLESLAGAAAGQFHRIVGPDDPAMPAFARQTSGYYVATFEPEPDERNGSTHRMEVRSARDGVRISARPEVLIPKPPARKPKTASPREMLRDAVQYRALPLRALAYASAGEPEKVKVLAVVEPLERGVKLVSAVFGLFNSGGGLVAQWTANSRELAGEPLITAGEAAPGPYRLRVAATDSNGRHGTVDYEFMARLTEAGPLMLSAIALGTTRDNAFVPKLVFGSDQAAVVLFEAYGTAAQDSLTVRLEVAADPDGRALSSAQPRILSPEPSRYMIVGALPIAALTPGDYVVRAIVSVDGRPVGRVYRTLRKVAGS